MIVYLLSLVASNGYNCVYAFRSFSDAVEAVHEIEDLDAFTRLSICCQEV